jgi:hypothetical protein
MLHNNASAKVFDRIKTINFETLDYQVISAAKGL